MGRDQAGDLTPADLLGAAELFDAKYRKDDD